MAKGKHIVANDEHDHDHAYDENANLEDDYHDLITDNTDLEDEEDKVGLAVVANLDGVEIS